MLLSVNLPYPPRGGPDLRAWQLTNALATVGSVGVFGLRPDLPLEAPREGIGLWRSSSDASLTADEGATSESLAWMKVPGGLPSDSYVSEQATREFADALEEFDPDVVVIDQLWLMPYATIARRHGCRIVLNEHNVEADLQRQLAAAESLPPRRLIRNELARRVGDAESAAVSSVDQVWVCSEADRELLAASVGRPPPLHVVPNAVDLDHYAEPEANRRHAHRLVYPGQFSYPPNVAAAGVLIDEIFPRVRRRYEDAQLLLVGRHPTAEMLATAADPGIDVTGVVDDIRPHLWGASAMAVPLRDGGGTRFKILEAFAAGVPVVSTAKGAEGLGVRGGEELLLAETAEEFAAQIELLWNDRERAALLTGRAGSFVRERFSWDAAARAVAEAVAMLTSPPHGASDDSPEDSA